MSHGQDLKDPSISPVHADVSKEFPPSYLSTGTGDLYRRRAARNRLRDQRVNVRLVPKANIRGSIVYKAASSVSLFRAPLIPEALWPAPQSDTSL